MLFFVKTVSLVGCLSTWYVRFIRDKFDFAALELKTK